MRLREQCRLLTKYWATLSEGNGKQGLEAVQQSDWRHQFLSSEKEKRKKGSKKRRHACMATRQLETVTVHSHVRHRHSPAGQGIIREISPPVNRWGVDIGLLNIYTLNYICITYQSIVWIQVKACNNPGNAAHTWRGRRWGYDVCSRSRPWLSSLLIRSCYGDRPEGRRRWQQRRRQPRRRRRCRSASCWTSRATPPAGRASPPFPWRWKTSTWIAPRGWTCTSGTHEEILPRLRSLVIITQ